MAFTDIEKVKIEVGVDLTDPLPIIADDEIQYFLEKNSNSVRKASLDVAKTILFKLSSIVSERADVLEYRGSDYFKQYKEALMMYISNPEFASVSRAMGYVSGISISDINSNYDNPDNNYVKVEKSIPIDYTAINLNNDSPFAMIQSNDPFKV